MSSAIKLVWAGLERIRLGSAQGCAEFSCDQLSWAVFSLKSEGHSLGILKWKSVVLNKLSFTDFYPAGLRWVDLG